MVTFVFVVIRCELWDQFIGRRGHEVHKGPQRARTIKKYK